MGALIGSTIATVLSLCILSRAIADNPLYRLAQALLVGIALGYISAALVRSTIIPTVLDLTSGGATTNALVVAGIGLVLGLLLITRFGRQRSSALANLPLGLLYGVGSAVALVGAVRGTLVPQLLDTVRLNPVQAATGSDLRPFIGTAVFVVLVVLTLVTFTYSVRAPQAANGTIHAGGLPARTLRQIGHLCIVLTFGVFFAATVRTYVSALVSQVGDISIWATAVWNALH